MVPFYDVPGKHVVRIPAAELRPGCVQARVEGIGGIVWVLPSQLQQGEVRHGPFDEEVRAYVRQIQETFAEHSEMSFDEWEDGLRRDAHPERETALWLHAADVYRAFAADEPSPARRAEMYRVVIACLTTGPDAVWNVIQLEALGRDEADRIVKRFYEK